ncbi:hypothetical protein, partial [Amycolatopsis sp. NPDC006125]|uniref:hypothetical protein n=1 Tax=Amycolatopsis sp. NPDC006125 TaxID=3156730 RepID=UPI0033A81BC8
TRSAGSKSGSCHVRRANQPVSMTADRAMLGLDDEESMMAETGGPVPDIAPAPQNDPEEQARRLLAEHLGAQPID